MFPICLAAVYLTACLHGLVHRLAARWLTPPELRRPQPLAALLRESVVWRNTIPIAHACDVSPLAGAPRRSAAVALAGPAATLLCALALVALAFAAPDLRLEASSALGALAFFVAFEALPLSRQGMVSDITLLRALARRDARGRRIAALAAIDRSTKAGRRPRDWHPALLADALALPDGSRADAEAALCAYYHALDCGDGERAGQHLQRAAGGAAQLGGQQRIVLRLEAAYLAGWLRRDAERAGAELRTARAEAGGAAGRHWIAVNRSLKGVPLRAASAVFLAAGEYDQAARTARQALLLGGAIVRGGPSAADAGACERDWLRALHEAATAAAREAASPGEADPSRLLAANLPALADWRWVQQRAREARPPRWPWVLAIIALLLTLPSIGRLIRLTNVDDVDALELPLQSLKLAHLFGWGALLLVCAALFATSLSVPLRPHRLVAVLPLLLCAGLCLLSRAIGAQDVRYDGGYSGFLSAESDWLLHFGAAAALAALLGLALRLRWERRHDARDDSTGAAAGRRPRWQRLARLGGWTALLGCMALGLLLVDLIPDQPSSALAAKLPTVTLGADPAGGSISFSFDAGIAEDVKEQIWQGAREAQAFFLASFGRGVQRPVLIDVRGARPASAAYGGYTAGHRIVLYTEDSDETPDGAYFVRTGVIHELFHVLQEEWSGGADERRSPRWLLEGSADYVSQLTMVRDGTMALDDLQACLRRQAGAGTARLPALQTLEPAMAIPGYRGDLYALAALGVDRLVARSGPPALGVFYSELTDHDWRGAFADAFGSDPATFYAGFEQARAAMRRPSRSACTFQDDEDD